MDILLLIDHLASGDDLCDDNEQVPGDEAVAAFAFARRLVDGVRGAHDHQAQDHATCGTVFIDLYTVYPDFTDFIS